VGPRDDARGRAGVVRQVFAEAVEVVAVAAVGVAVLGGRRVFQKILKKKRKSKPKVDEVQDGGRAQVIDEAIVAAVYEYADRHGFLEGATRVDWELLRSIKRLTTGFEVDVCSPAEWEEAILTGVGVWRQVRQHDGGPGQPD